ncbi:MAG: hypothetical protein JNL62_16640 [Bryobacterales bacterium]|nr:hypothetical protein [Bryobacterales bacterium]
MRHVMWMVLVAVLAAQHGPPELVNPSRDPFSQNPLERRSPAVAPRAPRPVSPEETKRSREDLARLILLTADVRKAMEQAASNTADVPTARNLEEIEKIAKRMRKRITR